MVKHHRDNKGENPLPLPHGLLLPNLFGVVCIFIRSYILLRFTHAMLGSLCIPVNSEVVVFLFRFVFCFFVVVFACCFYGGG